MVVVVPADVVVEVASPLDVVVAAPEDVDAPSVVEDVLGLGGFASSALSNGPPSFEKPTRRDECR